MLSKRSKRRGALAAPIVMTAIFAPGCEERIYRNPGPPQEPRPTSTATEAPLEPTATATVTAAVSVTATTTADAGLPPAPTNEKGKVARQPDGTCLFVFDRPPDNCPPTASCNPGPPRTPLKIKCP